MRVLETPYSTLDMALACRISECILYNYRSSHMAKGTSTQNQESREFLEGSSSPGLLGGRVLIGSR